MTPLRIVSLLLAISGLLALAMLAKALGRGSLNSARGVFWREALGFLLVLGSATIYCLAVGLPLLPLGIAWLMGGVIGVALLLLERADVLQDEPWEGMTDNGNLKRNEMHLIEDMMAVRDQAWEHHQKLQRELVKWKLLNMALREMEPTRSSEEWRRAVDEAMGHVGDDNA